MSWEESWGRDGGGVKKSDEWAVLHVGSNRKRTSCLAKAEASRASREKSKPSGNLSVTVCDRPYPYGSFQKSQVLTDPSGRPDITSCSAGGPLDVAAL